MRSVGKAQAQAGGCGGGLGRGRRVYLYGHGAGERERARQVRALAELERYVKGQALGGELAGGAALGGFFRGVPEPAVGGRVGQLRGEQLEAGAGGVGVFIGGVDDELWELIHAGYTAGMGYGAAGAGAGAQREPVGAGLDKARAVSGVLDRVGKDEGLFLRRVEFVHAEEVAHRHREQRGDPRAHEADRVLFPARGAAVFLGQLRGLVGGVGEHGHGLVRGGAVGFGRGRRGRAQCRGGRVEPVHAGLAAVAFDCAFGYLAGGVDERAFQAGVAHADPPDRRRRELVGVAAGGKGRHPAAAPAAPAVAGGKPEGARLVGGAVVGEPKELAGRGVCLRLIADGPLEAGKLAHPQVDLDPGQLLAGEAVAGAPLGAQVGDLAENRGQKPVGHTSGKPAHLAGQHGGGKPSGPVQGDRFPGGLEDGDDELVDARRRDRVGQLGGTREKLAAEHFVGKLVGAGPPAFVSVRRRGGRQLVCDAHRVRARGHPGGRARFPHDAGDRRLPASKRHGGLAHDGAGVEVTPEDGAGEFQQLRARTRPGAQRGRGGHRRDLAQGAAFFLGREEAVWLVGLEFEP